MNPTCPRVQVPAVVRIPALTTMLMSGTEFEGGVSSAMGALRAICATPEGRDAAVAAGVPAAVAAATATCAADARTIAAGVLSNMCVHSLTRVCGGGSFFCMRTDARIRLMCVPPRD